MQVVLIKQTLV